MTDDLRAQARALGDPVRFRIYEHIAESAGPVDVATLTSLVDLHHTAVRRHLARLVDANLVIESTERRTTRGRPRQLYRVDPGSLERWRDHGPYHRLSMLLVDLVSSGDPAADVGRRAGRETAMDVTTDPIGAIEGAVARGGFEPRRRDVAGNVELVLERCPFADAAEADPDLVCDLHLGLARGLADQLEDIEIRDLVRADPHTAGCRLKLRTAQ